MHLIVCIDLADESRRTFNSGVRKRANFTCEGKLSSPGWVSERLLERILHHHFMSFSLWREIGHWKEYLPYILCQSNTNMAVVSAIIWLYKQLHL